ncbi:9496_t:CDS:2, partial [Dentiscutata heterogama]
MEEDFRVEKQTYSYNFLPEVLSDIRVVVGIDFGTTFSGFACANIYSRDVITNQSWPGVNGQFKTNTVLQYNENYEGVVEWGARALVPEISRRESRAENLPRPIELFKLHLGNVSKDQKSKLPFGLTTERVITDYLRKMGEVKLIKETVEKHWPGTNEGTNFFRMVRLVVTIPAEFTEETKAIMRHCIYKANLISNSGTQSLQFTTEPEAAAVHCIKVLKDHELKVGSTYLIVDCGGGT